ncbi:MAG: toll/interleukin-1 receptor domain-containing protein [Gammaproteobacteria bacterium]
MYNLLMTPEEGAWDKPTWVIDPSRYLEHTHKSLQEKFAALTDDVIAQLKTIPALFTYEKSLKAPARVGRIVEIQQLTRDIRLTVSMDPFVPPIAPVRLEQLYRDLDIDQKYEVNRLHWALKNVDLAQVLTTAGIIPAVPLQAPRRPPKVFMSYSWETPEHKQWVSQLGAYLRSKGIDVILDQWHLRPGGDMVVFMQQSLQDANRVLVICTPTYVEKAARRTGGVGFEHMIVTGQMMKDLGTTKFIPIVFDTQNPVVPAELATRLYFNLGAGADLQDRWEALAGELHGAYVPPPPLGHNPYQRT